MERKIKANFSRNVSKTNTRMCMDLTEILQENALRYLPAKSLCRSLAVCREWKLQITSPFFIHSQTFSFRSLSGIFVQQPPNAPTFISLDQMAYGVPDQELKFLPEPVVLKASANGLLLCQGRGTDRAYYVCNPVNRQYKKLPKPTTDHGCQPVIALAFEPSLMGFVAEYKVVCLFASEDIDGAFEFDIYSSVDESWKVSKEMSFSKLNQMHFQQPVYVNGVVYWPTSSGKILSFNMKVEKSTEFYGPCYGTGSSSSLGTIYGKLCRSYMRGQSITVAVINAYANTTATLNTDSSKEERYISTVDSSDVKLLVHDQTRIGLAWDGVVVFQAGSRVFAHDMKTHRTTRLLGESAIDSRSVVLPYINSLACLI